jgi:tRNA nucleotidyltransferase/poly(A) polymerase
MGAETRVVGAVRDAMLDLPPHEIDLARPLPTPSAARATPD